MKVKKLSHSIYHCIYHILDKYPKISIEEQNHDKDHVHMLVWIPPDMKVSDFVRVEKSITGREMKKRFDFLRKAYSGVDGIWSDGYFVSTVGLKRNRFAGI